jgi:hypothetical protein
MMPYHYVQIYKYQDGKKMSGWEMAAVMLSASPKYKCQYGHVENIRVGNGGCRAS